MNAKQLKNGAIYAKNGYRVYYSAGYYIFSCFEIDKQAKFKTLKEVKNHIKTL